MAYGWCVLCLLCVCAWVCVRFGSPSKSTGFSKDFMSYWIFTQSECVRQIGCDARYSAITTTTAHTHTRCQIAIGWRNKTAHNKMTRQSFVCSKSNGQFCYCWTSNDVSLYLRHWRKMKIATNMKSQRTLGFQIWLELVTKAVTIFPW